MLVPALSLVVGQQSFLRVRRRARLPAPEMAAILERSGYRQPPPGWRSFYPVRRAGWHPKQGLLNLARQFVPRPEREEFSGQVVHSIEESGVRPEIDLILWPTYDEERRQGLLSRREEPGLFYSLPEEWEEAERVCHPFEGDWAFL